MNGEVFDEIKLPSSLVMEQTYRRFNKKADGICGVGPCFEYIDDCFLLTVFATK